MRNFATAFAIVLVASMFTGCASQPTLEPKRETARTAATPEMAAPANSCRQSGRTTMVRGSCPVDWDGQTVRVSGTCEVTPGTSSKGPCLRLQIKAASGDCIVSPGAATPAVSTEEIIRWIGEGQPGAILRSCRKLDATLLKNGDLHPGKRGWGAVICKEKIGRTLAPHVLVCL